MIQRLFDYLESRRVLWEQFEYEYVSEVADSLLTIRERLSDVQQQLSSKSKARPSVRVLRLACEEALRRTPAPNQVVDLHGKPLYPPFPALVKLRRTFGRELQKLSNRYEIAVEPPLAKILPSWRPQAREAASIHEFKDTDPTMFRHYTALGDYAVFKRQDPLDDPDAQQR